MAKKDLNFFFSAAQTGNINALQDCLDSGIDIHSCNDLALRNAKQNGHTETVIFLLNNGANIQAVNDDTLRDASFKGDFQTVDHLLKSSSCSQSAKIYAMYNAILCGHDTIVKSLLDDGVSPTINKGAILKVLKFCKYDKVLALFEDYLN